jgi:hypothetical protein
MPQKNRNARIEQQDAYSLFPSPASCDKLLS